MGLPRSLVLIACAVLMVAGGHSSAQSPPKVLTAAVTVVDRDGQPVPTLTADQFQVDVSGRRRRVLGASFARESTAEIDPGTSYVIVIDALTFGQGAVRSVVDVVGSFVSALPLGSRIGLSTVPTGPAVEVTADRAAIAQALDKLTGQQPSSPSGGFGLRAADVIEYLAATDKTAIVQGYCGTAEDDACPALVDQEMALTVNGLETQARASLGMLARLAERLVSLPGRTVVILVTGGVPASDRPGGRPDVGNLSSAIVDAAARGDITLYTLLVDRRLLDADVAAPRGRQLVSPARESEVLGRWAEEFSVSVGGAMFRVQGRQGDPAPARLARELSGYCQLTIESTDGDKPGAVQRLRVRVDERGTTVRARTSIVVK